MSEDTADPRTFKEQFRKIKDLLEQEGVPEQVTVRTMLSWFNVKRRGPNIAAWISDELLEAELTTNPDFQSVWLDSEIEFALAAANQVHGLIGNAYQPNLTVPELQIPDPTYRIGRLESANRRPLSVTPEQTVVQAFTVMLMNNFSQLPVMIGERDVKGVITLESIARRMALKADSSLVKDCMDPALVIDANRSLLEAIDDIVQRQYVLVQGSDRKITGIVTNSDLGREFRLLTEQFLR